MGAGGLGEEVGKESIGSKISKTKNFFFFLIKRKLLILKNVK